MLSINRQHLVWSLLILLLTFYLSTSHAEQTEDAKALALYDQIFDEWMERSPVGQSYLGIKTQNDQWDNLTESFAQEGLELNKRQLQSLKKIKFKMLSEEVKLSHRLLEQQLSNAIKHFKWHLYEYPVNQMFGWHTTVASTLMDAHPITTEKDAQDYIARLNGVDQLMEQLVENLEFREKKGILPPKFVYPKVIEDSQNLLRGAPFSKDGVSPILADFKSKISQLDLPGGDKSRTIYIEQAKKAMLDSFQPGYKKLIEFLTQQETRANSTAGAWKFPKGKRFYQAALQQTTTTKLSAEEIHKIGLDEVNRIHQEMHKIMQTVKFKGSLNEFFTFVKEDDQFYFSNDEKGRQAYLSETQNAIDEITNRLPELFITLPKAELKVKAVEAYREKSAGKAFYSSPPPDGSRPGIYYANLYDMRNMPKYQMHALLYHEGLPGHHLQLSIATELKDTPKFRKFGNYTAYIEGWGLYAELLPKEIGFYQDPYADFGRLAMELWRACRLVVDTGIHAKKWTREQAIEYLVENTPNSRSSAESAIERYIVMPSQATAYKIGMLKILELREALKVKQKDQFDIRQFHERILKLGPVPLNILEQEIL